MDDLLMTRGSLNLGCNSGICEVYDLGQCNFSQFQFHCLQMEPAGILGNWGYIGVHFCAVVLKKTLDSPLDCKEIKPVHPKGDQSWVFIGKTDVEAEAPILWPPDEKS